MRYDLRSLNWLTLATGLLMLVLPFAGPWWTGRIGEGAFSFAISPFDMQVRVGSMSLHSDLVGLFLLATKISFIVAGSFIVLASLLPKRWWSTPLMKFGIMKPFWSVIGLVLILVIGTFFVNAVLPGIVSSMAGEESLEMEMNIPYLMGTATTQLSVDMDGGQALISAPIQVGFTFAFWLAVITAGCGFASRLYNKRVVKT